jgi:hypothetical protein
MRSWQLVYEDGAYFLGNTNVHLYEEMRVLCVIYIFFVDRIVCIYPAECREAGNTKV